MAGESCRFPSVCVRAGFIYCYITERGVPAMTDFPLGPPVRIEVYRNDIKVKRLGGVKAKNAGGRRTELKCLTKTSLARLAFYANNTSVELNTMATLTYPAEYETDGAVVKYHLKRYLQFMRRRIRPFSYLWFLEFQKRGAPHFHVLYGNLGVVVPKEELSEFWYKVVGSGDEKHRRAGTRIERLRTTNGAGRYAASYAQKQHQKAVPPNYRNVGRFWGCSTDVVPGTLGEISLTSGYDQLHELLSRHPKFDESWMRYGTVFNVSGELLRVLGIDIDSSTG